MWYTCSEARNGSGNPFAHRAPSAELDLTLLEKRKHSSYHSPGIHGNIGATPGKVVYAYSPSNQETEARLSYNKKYNKITSNILIISKMLQRCNGFYCQKQTATFNGRLREWSESLEALLIYEPCFPRTFSIPYHPIGSRVTSGSF